jgi:hypothetical protein
MTEAGMTCRLRRAARPLGLQLSRRQQPPRGAGGRGPPAGLGRAGPDRPSRFYGVVRFAEAARALGLPTVFGTEVTLARPGPPCTGEPDPSGTHLVVLARDPEGYARLSTGSWPRPTSRGGEGAPIFTLDALAASARGHWLVLTGCRKGAVAAALMEAGPRAASEEVGRLIEAVRAPQRGRRAVGPRGPARHRPQRRAGPAGRRVGVDAVATNNVHYATPAGFRWPPRWPPSGPGGRWPSWRAGSPRLHRPACAGRPSSSGGSPAGPGWSSGPGSWAWPAPSTCAWWPRGCPTSRYRRGWTSRATCVSW